MHDPHTITIGELLQVLLHHDAPIKSINVTFEEHSVVIVEYYPKDKI